MDQALRFAGCVDAPQIANLINRAFAIEHFFRNGERINPDEVAALLSKGRFLVLQECSAITGCIYIDITNDNGYLGLLAVSPEMQRRGIGSMLLREAEHLCRSAGCEFVRLRIINLRAELLEYYRKRGFEPAGTENAPMIRTNRDLHFIWMAKALIAED